MDIAEIIENTIKTTPSSSRLAYGTKFGLPMYPLFVDGSVSMIPEIIPLFRDSPPLAGEKADSSDCSYLRDFLKSL